MVLKLKDFNINGIWALKPYHLGPWTLRVLDRHPAVNLARPQLFPEKVMVYLEGAYFR